MTIRSTLMAGAAMTALERSAGRFLRGPEDHPTDGGAPATPDVAPGSTEGGDPNMMPTPEPAKDNKPKEVTAEDLEAEFGGEPTADAEEVTDKGKSEESKPKEEAKPQETELEAAQREAREAREELDKLRSAPKQEAPKETPKQEEKVEPKAKPKPEDYEYAEVDPKYQDDLMAWHAEEAVRKDRETQDAKAAEDKITADVEALRTRYKANVARDAERLVDFDEKVNKTAAKGEWPCPPIVALAIQDSEVGPDIAYHLATNIEVAKSIAAMDTHRQAREIGRLEAGFLRDAEARKTAATEKTVTRTAAPPANRARGSGGQFATPADTDDFSAFERSADAILSGAR